MAGVSRERMGQAIVTARKVARERITVFVLLVLAT